MGCEVLLELGQVNLVLPFAAAVPKNNGGYQLGINFRVREAGYDILMGFFTGLVTVEVTPLAVMVQIGD